MLDKYELKNKTFSLPYASYEIKQALAYTFF